jgi:hypothetical protein
VPRVRPLWPSRALCRSRPPSNCRHSSVVCPNRPQPMPGLRAVSFVT